MIKVITFSLWGNNPTYAYGAIQNVKIAKEVYPEFECWIYAHTQTVPSTVIDELKTHDNVKVIMKDGDLNAVKPMTWRFEAIDDPSVECMMSRDTDTRILPREVKAVREWLSSGKLFHIMRDHPHHSFHILGGMFGTKKIPEIPSWKVLIDKVIQYEPRNYDQTFLKEMIYPIIMPNAMIHTSFKIYPSEITAPFPIPYDNEYRFVGEYVYADESRSKRHIDILKAALTP